MIKHSKDRKIYCPTCNKKMAYITDYVDDKTPGGKKVGGHNNWMAKFCRDCDTRMEEKGVNRINE